MVYKKKEMAPRAFCTVCFGEKFLVENKLGQFFHDGQLKYFYILLTIYPFWFLTARLLFCTVWPWCWEDPDCPPAIIIIEEFISVER